jgi:hypothetical protein
MITDRQVTSVVHNHTTAYPSSIRCQIRFLVTFNRAYYCDPYSTRSKSVCHPLASVCWRQLHTHPEQSIADFMASAAFKRERPWQSSWGLHIPKQNSPILSRHCNFPKITKTYFVSLIILWKKQITATAQICYYCPGLRWLLLKIGNMLRVRTQNCNAQGASRSSDAQQVCKGKAIPVTGCGNPQVVRRRGSHIF